MPRTLPAAALAIATALGAINQTSAQTTSGSASSSEPEAELSVQQILSDVVARGMGNYCEQRLDPDWAEQNPVDTIPFQYTAEGADESQDYILYRIPCYLAAYNAGSAWALEAPDNKGRPRLLSFSLPVVAFEYEDPDTEKVVIDFQVTGYSATGVLGGAFDPDTLEIESFNKARGLGDAFSNGFWTFNGRDFVLRRYDVDPTYDEKAEAVTVIDFTKETP